MSTLIRRIAASTGANAYAQATTIGIQLLSLPLFLSHWGLATYGQWLVLSAIPAYFSMADVGMVAAAGNRMTMLMGQGDERAANGVFQSAIAFMSVVCVVSGLLAVLVIAVLPQAYLPSGDSRYALVALVIGVLVGLFSGLPEAVYRATHRYAFGTFAANSARLCEWLGGLAGLWWFGSFLAVALGMLACRVVATVFMMFNSRRGSQRFVWGFAEASRAEIKATAAPAIAFMAFPAGNAIAFQGVTLMVAATLGPAATAIFNTYRTMGRVTVQATATFGNALWPEFSRLYGGGDMALLGIIFRRAYLMSLLTSVLASAVVYALAPYVLDAWSKGKISFVPHLMITVMLYAAIAGCWHVCRVLLLATNRHGRLAWQYLLASALTLPVTWLLGHSFQLVGAMASMVLAEVFLLVLCTASCRRLIGSAPMRPLVRGV